MADAMEASPLRQDIIGVAASQERATVAQAAMAKEDKYAVLTSLDNFLPLVIAIFGQLHHQFDGLLQRAGSLGTPLSILTTHFHQRTLVRFQRAQARASVLPRVPDNG